MKYINILILLITITISSAGCTKKQNNTISSGEILSRIKQTNEFENYVEESLKDQSVAERYGISPADIEDGVVYYTSDNEKSDKIIIARVGEEKNVEKVEGAISAEIVGMTDSWSENKEESKKIEEHIFKTKGLYVILCVSENAEEIVEEIDNILM